MSPNKVEYDLGQNIYGQPLRLVCQRDTGGVMAWTLCRDAADQRDDSTFIAGMTRTNLEQIAEAVRTFHSLPI